MNNQDEETNLSESDAVLTINPSSSDVSTKVSKEQMNNSRKMMKRRIHISTKAGFSLALSVIKSFLDLFKPALLIFSWA